MPERQRSAARILCGAAAVLYPFWAWWGLSRFGIAPVAGLLAVLAVVRAAAAPAPGARALAVAACVLAGSALLLDDAAPALLYPVVVNAAMLGIFGSSLFSGMPVVERLARIREPALPPEGVRWCRGVTCLWCGFFVVNGLIALGTVLHGDLALWTLWNGCLSYVAMGLLFAAEWVARRLVIAGRSRRPRP